MSEAIYERYKDSLRRGHVAAMRGRHEAALAAYVEAAEIAPERALPHTSIGQVCARLGRMAEALTAYAAALDRTPADAAALEGRAGPEHPHPQAVPAGEREAGLAAPGVRPVL